MSREIGIDLGTTYSVVAAIVDNRILVAENREGNTLTPSVVYFSEDGQAVVGERVLHMIIARPDYCVWEVKRMMGEDVTAYVHPDTGQKYSPVEISSLILKELKESAELYFGETVDSAVISVPAYFDNAARQATGEAANLAGLKVLRIANEPSMALRAYMFSHKEIRGAFTPWRTLAAAPWTCPSPRCSKRRARSSPAMGTGAWAAPTSPWQSRSSFSRSSRRSTR